MCDHDEHDDGRMHLSRRGFLLAGGVAGLGAAGHVPVARAATTDQTLLLPGGLEGTHAQKVAGHLHASNSELYASMASHLVQLDRYGYDRAFWTDHGWMQAMLDYRQRLRFAAQKEFEPATGTTMYYYPQPPTGAMADSGSGFVATPASPLDPAGGSLRLHARGSGTGEASLAVLVSNAPTPTGSRLRSPTRGQIGRVQLTLELTPVTLGAGSLDLVIDLSNRPQPDGALGQYQLVYRFADAPAGRRATGRLGVVTVPVAEGARTTATLDPVTDIAALWPDQQAHDHSLVDLRFAARSVDGGQVEGRWESLRLQWCSVDRGLQIMQDLIGAYSKRYPALAQHNASEISWLDPHICRLGGDQHLQDLTRNDKPDAAGGLVAAIRASGGVATWNHPYGTTSPAVEPPAQLAARRRSIFTNMMRTGMYGCDALEVAYARRGGADLRAHVDLAYTLWRNLVLVSAIGANDSHNAADYGQLRNGFHTVTLGPDGALGSALAAYRSGQLLWAHTGLAPQTVLDLTLASGARMGSVSVSSARSQAVVVRAGGLPPGSTVRVLQGLVDFAGASRPDPVYAQISRLTAGQLAAPVKVPFRVAGPGSWVVLEVLARDGRTVIAGSNPVFVLTHQPPDPVPAVRQP